jgi:hypothetical protein
MKYGRMAIPISQSREHRQTEGKMGTNGRHQSLEYSHEEEREDEGEKKE